MDLRHEVTFEFRDAKVPAEQVGWVYAIRSFPLGALKNRSGCVAVVVDHQLGELVPFNRREKRIANMMYLPPEFTLVYASSERGKNQFVNKAMNMADWLAGRMLDLAVANLADCRGLIPAEKSEPFAFRREWISDGYEAHDMDSVKQTMKFHLE